MSNNIEGFITINDLARLLNITRQAIQKQLQGKIESGEVKIKRLHRQYLIDINSLPQDIKDRVKKVQQEAVKTVLNKPISKTDIEIEKELWSAADKLRGSIDASDYKNIVLGLLFLKYISDAFYERKYQLEKLTTDKSNKQWYVSDNKARYVVINDKDQYKREGLFYVPEKAYWDTLRSHAMQSDFGVCLDDAMDAIEQENPSLKGVLPKIYAKTSLDNNILAELINIFSRIKFDHDLEKEKDMLGRVYEYFLGQFASAEGKRGGEFFTPRSIVKLIVEILEPYENARVFDPACGSGGMFVQSSEFLRIHHKEPSKISFFGQESNPTTIKLCRMNLAIRGITGDIQYGNSYYEDKFSSLFADFVIANPPFNAEWEPKRLNDSDPRIKYGTPPSGSANFMWIQHFIHHLAPNGMAGFVMANGALAVSGKEGVVREKIIKDDLIDVIIACPPKLFYNVSLPVSLWFVSKNKKNGRFRDRTRQILFIDAREIFNQISRKQVEFTTEQIKRIADTVRAWREKNNKTEYKDIAGYCKSATLDEITKNGYVLTPGRYVGVPEEIDDGIPFGVKMKKLEIELKESFKDSERLEKTILENLKIIKY